MAGLKYAADALKTFGATVTGVTTSYGIENYFDQFLGVRLPALVVVPGQQESVGFRPLTFMGNSPKVQFVLEHWLLYQKWDSKADKAAVMPAFFDLLDTYLNQLKATPFLTSAAAPATHEPLRAEFGMGILTWGDAKYFGAVFRFQFGVNL